MKRWTVLCAGVATAAVLATGLAVAQQPPPQQPRSSADCKAGAPEKVEGQVVSVDPAAGKVTVREKNGKTHEFQSSRETLQNMKAGDTIEARLREAPKC
jgi:hypothetical protein